MVARSDVWNAGEDETVEVNQRALIDKVLARYSGEFTVFRELLQNSDDASSKSVQIHFDTTEYLENKHDEFRVREIRSANIQNILVHHWTFMNDGILFRDQDWNRLKKIADGNPDEQKIGAFGVGFYSLFSVTEEPFVTSGDKWMGFYWKDGKDQLYARKGNLTEQLSGEALRWTSFDMPLRDPTPLPDLSELSRFLASSITFMVNLDEVSLFVNGERMSRVWKTTGVPLEVSLPRTLKPTTPLGTMKATSLKSTPLQIDAEMAPQVYRQTPTPVSSATPSVTSRPVSVTSSTLFGRLLSRSSIALSRASSEASQSQETLPTPIEKDVPRRTSIGVNIFSVGVDVKLDAKLNAELNRAMKKNPPSRLKLDLIYTGKDEYEASTSGDESHAYDIFRGLRADLNSSGSARVFIGHATAQTTGVGGHMSGRFIPTVERESIDLEDRSVAVWNRELLSIGGYLARAIYETEMAKIQGEWDRISSIPGDASSDALEKLEARFLHLLKFFSFHSSTPLSAVSTTMESAFFDCGSNQTFNVLSNKGIRDSRRVRIPDESFAAFIRFYPLLPAAVSAEAERMVDILQRRRLISPITTDDVLNEIRSRALTTDEAVACLKWWIKAMKDAANLKDKRKIAEETAKLVPIQSLVRVQLGDGDKGKTVNLGVGRYFLNLRVLGSIIPLNGPMPVDMVPIAVSRQLIADETKILGWKELTVVDWIRSIASLSTPDISAEFDILQSSDWSKRVLGALARAWPSLSQSHKEELKQILSDKAFIPSTKGLKVASEVYFKSASIFEDLPMVDLGSGKLIKGVDDVLATLGVRNQVAIDVIFDRMMKTGNWNASDLIKYLVSVQKDLACEDLMRLKEAPVFSTEAVGDATTGTNTRYKISELYEPTDMMRSLGLPVLLWGTSPKWRASSTEAKTLFDLGLLRQPPLSTLLTLAASDDALLADRALNYFLAHVAKYPDYDPLMFSDTKYVPANGSNGGMVRGSPLEVFTDSEYAKLGFLSVHDSIRSVATDKLKLRKAPLPEQLVSLLERSRPTDFAGAKAFFELMSDCLSDFSQAQIQTLAKLPFVPVTRQPAEDEAAGEGSTEIIYSAPRDCYIIDELTEKFHRKLFSYVDFGTKPNRFLITCGAKYEPSTEAIVQTLLADTVRFFTLSGGGEGYLNELRKIALNQRFLKSATLTRMKNAPILLGGRRRGRDELLASEKDNEDVEGRHEFEFRLLLPKQIIIADDSDASHYFEESIYTAPPEDLLENFYSELGSPSLKDLIRQEFKVGSEIKKGTICEEMRALVLQRLPLFLHEYSQGQMRVTYKWLCSGKNFVVRSFSELTVVKHLVFGTTRLSHSHSVSAAAQRSSKGVVELWLGDNTNLDMYDVAISLCRVLFPVQRSSDVLLFMTLLSTDLPALRRRGYNVDRLLRQQEITPSTTDKGKGPDETEMEQLLGGVNPWAPNGLPASLAGLTTVHLGIAQEQISRKGKSTWLFRKLFKSNKPAPPHRPRDITSPTQNYSENYDVSGGGLSASPIKVTQPAIRTMADIESYIHMAISACRTDQNTVSHAGPLNVVRVKESADEGYCDVSGRGKDLDFIGNVSDFRVYASKDVEGRQNMLQTKREQIERFTSILWPLRILYDLPKSSIHIFLENEGATIAVNRGGSIFVNLKFYESWHDEQVKSGIRSRAFSSWFFTLAHEIAHNLVSTHSSQHEFYFATICESHVDKLVRLLQNDVEVGQAS